MAVEGSRSNTTRLLIKSPNQTLKDHSVDGVHLDWTVKDLKTLLSKDYPTKPAVSDQRLIFAGKLLPDHFLLRDIFTQTDSVNTLHLVSAFRTQHGVRAESTETEGSQRLTAASVSTSNITELRHRSHWTSSSSSTAVPMSQPWSPADTARWGAPQVAPPTFPSHSLYSGEQLLWLQLVYTRQFYLQYHAALAAANSASSPPASVVAQYPPVPAHQVVPTPAPRANENPVDDLPANQNAAQDGAFIGAGVANQNLRMNAQGGAVMEDEDAAEHDWLDWFYSAARLGVLLMIVYFNSNLSRLLLVMSTLLLLYLHTAGWFPFRRPQAQRPDHLQPLEVRQNQQNQNRNPADVADRQREELVADRQREELVADRQREELVADRQGEELVADRQREELVADRQGEELMVAGHEAMMAVLVPAHRTSVMWTAWVFFRTFFSSLIPEGQHI
ncbi:homocysteine-responsive endoplasmic reticulum-resident ubiquitin-like domain member 1 protein [Solea solea]|uniref:homocysteine-responsive endoplasmic reticulum-resident ubiquitin-like domain member 1 protein n=1 Tax=Solea solea TaxID=90069 RepID=UPI002729BBC9|nr:homocysteine-responsive endoplasmic reticulum-resident ubiquitin-like domain member 1 protein [Solea solea]